jgi:hypothetical protein
VGGTIPEITAGLFNHREIESDVTWVGRRGGGEDTPFEVVADLLRHVPKTGRYFVEVLSQSDFDVLFHIF